jgi:hypothetical protein
MTFLITVENFAQTSCYPHELRARFDLQQLDPRSVAVQRGAVEIGTPAKPKGSQVAIGLGV